MKLKSLTLLPIAGLVICAALSGCASAQYHRNAVTDDSGEKISVGTVQREIKVGMSSADVVGVLGSPNMVTTDEERREVWVYDKVATDYAYSSGSNTGGVGAGGIIGATGIGGLLGGSQQAGATSKSQRTLTIVIKFDNAGKVRDYSYRQSKF